MQHPIGILGGTFDPIHLGHLYLANAIQKQFAFEKVKIIPCYQSPTRSTPIASALDRVAMIKLAIAQYPKLELDEREIIPPEKSYTIETLQALRQELPNVPLCLIIGSDTFQHLSKWREGKKITELAHLIVAKRPDTVLNDAPLNPPLSNIHHNLGGSIFIVDINALKISSTIIRNLLQQQKNVTAYVAAEVLDYIDKHGLYKKLG